MKASSCCGAQRTSSGGRRSLLTAAAFVSARNATIKRAIESSVDITASATSVWEVLTGFGSYADWNPFITSIIGAPIETTRLQIRIEPPGRSAMVFKPLILKVTPDRQLTWLGRFLVPGLFDGRHDFRIEETPGGCRFHQSEQFRGILVRLFGTNLLSATQRGFEAMNAALKERAERQSVR